VGNSFGSVRSHFENPAFTDGPYLLREIEESLSWASLSTNIYCDKLEEISDFSWMLPRAIFGPRAAICPHLH